MHSYTGHAPVSPRTRSISSCCAKKSFAKPLVGLQPGFTYSPSTATTGLQRMIHRGWRQKRQKVSQRYLYGRSVKAVSGVIPVIQLSPAFFRDTTLDVYKYPTGRTRESDNDAPWFDLRTDLDIYKQLTDDDHAQRKTKLSRLEQDIQAWLTRYNGLEEKEQNSNTNRGKYVAIEILQSMFHDEWQELESFGATLDPKNQQIKSKRLKMDYVLEAIMGGHKVVRDGETGIYVRKIQRSLAAISCLAETDVSGKYDAPTRKAVIFFQRELAQLPATGIVDAATMKQLDWWFSSDYITEKFYTLEHAGKPDAPEGRPYDVSTTPAYLLAGTHALSDAEKPMVENAVYSGGTRTVAGHKPAFTRNIPAGEYKSRIKAKTLAYVDRQYRKFGVGKEAKHQNKANLFKPADINRVAGTAKKCTDKLFSKYARGPALQYGVNIFDKWEFETQRLGSSRQVANSKLRGRVWKIIRGKKAIKKIDKEHGADQSREPEKTLLKTVVTEIVAAKRAELMEIQKGWPGTEIDGKIYIQRFRGANDNANRKILWKLFQTMIHEYIHTLEHPDCITYRTALPSQSGGKTIGEGFTDYFYRVVWHNTFKNNALRKDIEGPLHDPDTPTPIPRRSGYAEADNAERVASIIGFRNLAAAYFLGHIDRLKF